MMHLTATHINYFFICHRKLWLFSNGIHMEHTSDAVAEGKPIGETTYLTTGRKIYRGGNWGNKIDFNDAKNKLLVAP